MPYKITGDCIVCGDCYVICPENAIQDGYTCHPPDDLFSNEDFFRITKDCNNCGQCAGVCPAGAIIKYKV